MRSFLKSMAISLANVLASVLTSVLTCVLAFLLWAVPAQAKDRDISALWVQQLLRDGYEEIEVSQTWLGRIRINAEKGDIEREIIFNPRTGEVLRDYSRGEDGGLRLPLGFDVEFDDDDDDDKDKEDDDDKGGRDKEDDDDRDRDDGDDD